MAMIAKICRGRGKLESNIKYELGTRGMRSAFFLMKLCLSERLCCTNRLRDSLLESSMIAGWHEQLGPYEVQDHELVGLQ